MKHNTHALTDFIYDMSSLLDDEQFEDVIKFLDVDFRYHVCAYSNELGKWLTYLDHDYSEMKDMLAMIPQHVRLDGKFFRTISMVQIKNTSDDIVDAKSKFMLSHTSPCGKTKLFAVGRYEDRLRLDGSEYRLLERKVILETRDLSPGIHIPI